MKEYFIIIKYASDGSSPLYHSTTTLPLPPPMLSSRAKWRLLRSAGTDLAWRSVYLDACELFDVMVVEEEGGFLSQQFTVLIRWEWERHC